MSDEEFDEESFQAYENDLYGEKSDSDNEIDSDIEETLYSQVHYSFSLPEDEKLEDSKDCGQSSDAESILSSPMIINVIDNGNTNTEVITIEDHDDDDDDEKDYANDSSKKDDKNDNYRVSKTSPEAQENWDLIDKDLEDDMARTGKRGPSRYYIEAKKNSNFRCRNCNERGHLARDCPAPKKIISCSLCGISGHIKRECPNELCFNCFETGHRSFKCPQPRVRWSDKCRRCFQSGHHSHLCPDIWRQFHRTTVAGIPPVPDRTEEFTGPVYCYNCSAQGHYGHECIEERPGADRTPCYFQFIVRYDKENPSPVVNEKNMNRKRKHERESDTPIDRKQSKKAKKQNKQQQQQQREEDDSDRRKSWPRQGNRGEFDDVSPIRSKGKNKNRKLSWPIENNPGTDGLIPVSNKVSKSKQKSKGKASEPPAKSVTPKSRNQDEKKEGKNSRKVRQDKNKKLVMQLNAQYNERSVKIASQKEYYDCDKPELDTSQRTVTLKDSRKRRLSDSLMKIVDDWEKLRTEREIGNSAQNNLSQGSSRKDRYCDSPSRVFLRDNHSPSYDRSSRAFTNNDRSQSHSRDLPSLLELETRAPSDNSQYQKKRKKKFRSFQNSCHKDNRSFQDYDYNESIPDHCSRGRYSSSDTAYSNRDNFQSQRNQIWPKNKSRNSERGFRSKKKKNFTM